MFNTLLWQVTVRSDSAFYYGIYSILDKDNDIKFRKLPYNHELLDKYKEESHVKILTWFAQGYYNVEDKGDGVLQISNLRFGLLGFGLMGEMEDPYLFKYRIAVKDGKFECWPIYPDMKKVNMGEMFSALWTRMWGKN
jgi:inner membrane protein